MTRFQSLFSWISTITREGDLILRGEFQSLFSWISTYDILSEALFALYLFQSLFSWISTDVLEEIYETRLKISILVFLDFNIHHRIGVLVWMMSISILVFLDFNCLLRSGSFGLSAISILVFLDFNQHSL